MLPGCAISFAPLHSEGAGNAGRFNAPAALRAEKKHASKSPQVRRKRSGIPRANGFTTYSVLSPAIGLVVTVIGAMCQHRHPLHASVEALRPHGFIVRDEGIRLMHRRVHRIPRQRS
jgi:hypothetical protein